MNQWWRSQQKLIVMAIAALIIIITPARSADELPKLAIHELPPTLAQWSAAENRDNYFGQIEPTPLGYLIWSEFPITVYVEQPSSSTDSAADRRHRAWVSAVEQAIAEWNVYLPLKEIATKERADITILRSQPKREAKLNPNTGLFDIPRAVTAETTYKFYLRQNPQIVAHKMKLEISPNYTGISLLATVRHELGHALGIWGHSKDENDALYFSQVSNPPRISVRDINTLKKIYQQPTKLGWKI